MEEVLTEVKAYRAEAYCACGGELVAQDHYYPTYPPMFPHVCDDCGGKENLNNKYPRIVYR